MASLLRRLQRWCRKTLGVVITKITAVDQEKEWLANRRRFVWQRLYLWLWLVLICLFSFTLGDIYNILFPLQDVLKLPEPMRIHRLCINLAMVLSLGVYFSLRKTEFGHRNPGLLFLGSSWSVSLASQLFATLKGFALPDTFGWSLLFFSQAILIPVCWRLHLISQVGVLIYYFGVNTALGLKSLIPRHPEIYNLSFILYVFWLCAICDIGVYLYDRLQRSEFYARKEIESAYKKLEVTEAKYRSIFENAVEGIFQSTTDGRYITANPALARIYGYASGSEVIAKFTDIEQQLYVDPKRYAEFVRLIEQHSQVSDFESQIYRRDGSIVWISQKAYAVRDEQGNLLYYEGLISDITERKQAEEALRVFFHAVSHDLRNPVLGMLMVLKNLLNSGGIKGEGKESAPSMISVSRGILERMVQSSDRQLNLINSLMEAHVSEVQGVVLQRQPLQLHRVVADAIADLEPMLVENQAILTNLVTADLPVINGDPTQLWRVFSNLIVNAVKHNPPGLQLTIKATLKGDEKIYCTVSDNGVGISQEQSERLFDLYFRGSNQRNCVSLGLGLYICKRIINAHGGEIGVNSTLTNGATFWFTLPLSYIMFE